MLTLCLFIISHALAWSLDGPFDGPPTIFSLSLAVWVGSVAASKARTTHPTAQSWQLQLKKAHPLVDVCYGFIFYFYVVILILVTCTMLLLLGNHMNYAKSFQSHPYNSCCIFYSGVWLWSTWLEAQLFWCKLRCEASLWVKALQWFTLGVDELWIL